MLPFCSLGEIEHFPVGYRGLHSSPQAIRGTETQLSKKDDRVVNVIVDFDAVNNILRATIEGRITGEILLNFHHEAENYLAAHPPCRVILDLSPVTEFDVSSDAIRRLAAAHRR